jgi:hypothetical protein
MSENNQNPRVHSGSINIETKLQDWLPQYAKTLRKLSDANQERSKALEGTELGWHLKGKAEAFEVAAGVCEWVISVLLSGEVRTETPGTPQEASQSSGLTSERTVQKKPPQATQRAGMGIQASDITCGSALESIREIINSTMQVAENLPMGGIGEDGSTQEDLDAADNEGHPIDNDAVYHAGQQIWLNLKKALNELNTLERNWLDLKKASNELNTLEQKITGNLGD